MFLSGAAVAVSEWRSLSVRRDLRSGLIWFWVFQALSWTYMLTVCGLPGRGRFMGPTASTAESS